MLQRTMVAGVALVLAASVGSPVAHAVMLGQVDDFQNGSTGGWGTYAPVANIATGGPAGAGDRYLQVTSSGGTGYGSQLSTASSSRWGGDYAGAGVTAVEMDLRNFGNTPLEIRVLLWSANNGSFTSTVSFSLPVDGQWHHAVLGVRALDLTWGGDAYGNPAHASFGDGLWIRHQTGPPAAVTGGTPIASQLGIDNIHAVPEPGTLALVIVGAAMLRRRRIP